MLVDFVVNTYQAFNILLSYSQTPDSMNMLIASSTGYSPKAGSKIFVAELNATLESRLGIERLKCYGSYSYVGNVFGVYFFMKSANATLILLFFVISK